MSTEHRAIVHVLGGGGHGKVVVDALLAGTWTTNQILVQDDVSRDSGLLGCEVRAPLFLAAQVGASVHAAIGNGLLREKLLSIWPEQQWQLVQHPKAICATSGRIGPGSFIAALAVVGPSAKVGRSVIINHGAVVDHDSAVGDFSHIGPLASLGGGARVGRHVLIGAGARILPGVQVGDDAVVGAGAVVLSDVEVGGRVGGVPARNIKKRI